MVLQVSPGVAVVEVDLTPSVPAVSVSTGAIVGQLNWGPVLQVTSISSENQLANTFSQPDNNTAPCFFPAASFLAYSNALFVVRQRQTGMFNACANSGANANTAAGSTGANVANSVAQTQPILIMNDQDYFSNGFYTTQTANNSFTARFPGLLGNSLRVITWSNANVWFANATNQVDPLYNFANYFQHPPGGSSPQGQNGTTQYCQALANGAVTNDAMHILVVDALGYFTGVANTVLERYSDLSKLTDALNSTGGTNYYKQVIYQKSKYVHVTGTPTANTQGWDKPTNLLISLGQNFVPDNNANNANLAGGNIGINSDSNVITGWGLFSNKDFIDVGLLITGDVSDAVKQYAIQSVAAVRTDCIAFASAPFANVTAASGAALSVQSWASNTSMYSSFAVLDSGYKYMYDKYNDVYRWVPLNGDVAGLCAFTDNTRDPWWSPAGFQRGNIKNAIQLAFNPSKTDRDILYQSGINPVVQFPGQGIVLFGDKTFLNYSSAFDRINVRRLFIVLEKAISRAAKAQLFEFNDQFTRAQFVAMVEPFLRQVQGRRGITSYKVICDQTNNTPDVINANQFVGSILVVPNYSINYITLNFVAVRNGVDFNTVVGSF